MKRRSVIMIIMTFMLLTLVGVGFAAWVITAPTTDSTVTGNIQVEKVESKVSWQFEAYWVEKPTTDGAPVKKDDANNVVFGMPADTITKAWLTNDSIGEENLTVYLYVVAKVDADPDKKVDVAKNDFAKVDLKAVIPNPQAGEDGQSATIDEKLGSYLQDVASVKVTLVDSDTEVIDLTSEQLKAGVVLKITFGWKYSNGTELLTTNPYTHFNGLTYSPENAEAANTYLTSLYSKLEKCSFKVVLTADVKTVS